MVLKLHINKASQEGCTMDKKFKYQEASMADLHRRWDINIANNTGDDNWITWKTEVIKKNESGEIKTFVVLYGEEPIGEGTLVFSTHSVEINALRIEKQFEGKGHISKLVKVMEQYAKSKGYRTATIGVEPEETRNISIYLHWGYDTFVKSEYSEIEEGLILVYSKEL